MGEIRLYRQIYCFSTIGNGTTNQTLVDANTISASTTTVAGTGSTIVESLLTPVNESTGIYFVDLDPFLYSSDVTYELNWYVSYLPGAPEKILPTRFRVSQNIVGQQIEVELVSYPINILLD